MIASAGALGFHIYKIQEVWEGQSELQYENDALKTLPWGLWFFCSALPPKSPKGMGLAGVHNPDTLSHLTGVTFCPWRGKEGQKKVSIVNQLQTTHYKLGLVCKTCFCCPSVTSEAIWHHSQKKLQTAQRRRWGPWQYVLIHLNIPWQQQTTQRRRQGPWWYVLLSLFVCVSVFIFTIVCNKEAT